MHDGYMGFETKAKALVAYHFLERQRISKLLVSIDFVRLHYFQYMKSYRLHWIINKVSVKKYKFL